jgi:hypothetical protein
VMMPKSMSFKPGGGVSFESLNETPGALTYLARNGTPAHPFAFTVSGSGAMPRDTQAESQTNDNAGATDASGNADTRPGGGLGVPIDTPDPLNKYKWWILAGVTLVFAVGAGFLLRSPGDSTATEVAGASSIQAGTPGGLLAALKDELFTLETDHLQGRLTDTEYEQQKQALELVLRRALAKKPA